VLTVFASTVFAAQGIVGDCVDCHTMHNSEGGLPVAEIGTTGTVSATPIENLLRMDCVACHANDPTGGSKIWTMTGGSTVPQVMHGDTTGDLAGGNFRYIMEGGDRKGHNVVDVVAVDGANLFPPGHRHATSEVGDMGFDVENFTCAGSMGCHGYRGQVLTLIPPDPNCDPEFGINIITGEPCTPEELNGSTEYRTGIKALSGYDGFPTATLKSGAHHFNFEGLKNDGLDASFYDNPLSHSYRFIRSLRGYGNETDRWQNVDKDSHNEYAAGYDGPGGPGNETTDFGTTSTCSKCHVSGKINTTDARLTTPMTTMTGFCITCHGSFHSPGTGPHGAFLRHPSDYVIPDSGEYAAFTEYTVSAPVGRPAAFFSVGMTSSPTVTPGTDLVMCLSCHVAHAGPNDGMLRYSDWASGEGCVACHTTK